jgi:glucose/arabinose dehydrogenase
LVPSFWLAAVAAYLTHGNVSKLPIEQMEGRHPKLVDPEPETIPTVGLAKSVGWGANGAGGRAGLTVTRFAEGLQHPRNILTLPNGDVLVAETGAPKDNGPGGITGFFQNIFMSFVGAGDPSPNRIVLLRDSKGTGKADQRFVLRHGLSSPRAWPLPMASFTSPTMMRCWPLIISLARPA